MNAGRIALVFITLLALPRAYAADPKILLERKDNKITLDASALLTEKQKKLINSGFTAISMLEVKSVGTGAATATETEPIGLTCTVRYDTWNERFEVTIIRGLPTMHLVKAFNSYGKYCLKWQGEQAQIEALLQSPARRLEITLLVDQLNVSKADEIKQWLIRQQTGIMQGLFSHMLGELKLTEKSSTQVIVPKLPRPEPSSPQENRS